MNFLEDRRINFLNKACLITISFQVLFCLFYVNLPAALQVVLFSSVPVIFISILLLNNFSNYRLASIVFHLFFFVHQSVTFVCFSNGVRINIGAALMMGCLSIVSSILIGQRWGILMVFFAVVLISSEMYFDDIFSSRFMFFGDIRQKGLYTVLSIVQPAILVHYLTTYFYHALEQEEKDKKEMKTRLEEILANSMQTVILIDKNRELMYADDKSRELFKSFFGVELSEGVRCDLYAPTHLQSAFKESLEKAFAGEKIVRERKVKFADDKQTWFLVMYAPLYDSEGEVDVVQFSLLDISSQKNVQEELQKAEEQWKYALNSSQDGVWDWSVKDGKAYFSKMWKEMLGYEEGEILDSWAEWERLVHPEDKQKSFEEILKHVKNQTENYILEHRLLQKNGTYKWILARGKIIERDSYENPIRFIGTHTDIDHIKKVESDLKMAQEKAEQAAEAKSQFLSTISHEIRTPLNAVIGFSNLLLRENPESQNSEYLQNIQTSASHLLSLVNNVLDISKIESGKIEFEKREFELGKLINENISMLSLRAKEKAINLRVGSVPALSYHIVGDAFRLTQVLNNLLGNAVKFTSKGYVQMDVEIVSEDEKEIALKFVTKDSGTGIPKNKIDSIFESFSQASSDTARRYGGTGLGLTISKHLVNLQGGDIKVESVMNEGSTFYFTLTFPKGRLLSRGDVKPLEEKEEPLNGMRVLVAEDNIFNTKVLTRFLELWQIEYSVAANGQEALDLMQTNEFDLVLMDLHMPVMDGYEATQKIRESGNAIYIMALTASGNFSSREEMKQKGFDGYSVKPINTKELYKKLKEIKIGLTDLPVNVL